MNTKTGCRECGEPILVGELCYDHAKLCTKCGGPYDHFSEHVCINYLTFEAFKEWANKQDIPLNREEDWRQWYECWVDGMNYGLAVEGGQA